MSSQQRKKSGPLRGDHQIAGVRGNKMKIIDANQQNLDHGDSNGNSSKDMILNKSNSMMNTLFNFGMMKKLKLRLLEIYGCRNLLEISMKKIKSIEWKDQRAKCEGDAVSNGV